MTSPRMQTAIEQFAHGKLIDDRGRDLHGFTIVARSPGAPDDDQLISRIRARANVGQIYDLGSYAGSDVAFTFEDYVIAGRFQRSAKQYERQYFLQEHYLILPRSHFFALGHNYAYLVNLLPPTIPWRSQHEELTALPLPTRSQQEEMRRTEEMLNRYGSQILQTLQLALEEQPFVVVPPAGAPEQTVAFLETLGLLLPPGCRAELAWATNVMNAQQCKARAKIVSDDAVGTEGYAFVRLAAKQPSQPLRPGSDSVRSYINTIRLYLDRFGPSELLKMVEIVQVPPDTPWQELAPHLETGLWQNAGPPILEKDLEDPSHLNRQMLYDSMLPMLEQEEYNLTPERRFHFLAAAVTGMLDGTIPTEFASRIRRMAEQRLISADANYQMNLLNRALAGGPSRAKYRPEALLLVWAEMASNPGEALQVAQGVQPISAMLWHNRSGKYAYIVQGLNRAAAQQVDQLLAKKPQAELDANAALLLGLALMGERLGLPGFRSARLLSAVNRQAERLTPEKVVLLTESLDKDVAKLHPEAASTLAQLMLTQGQSERFERWLDGDWRWIDVLIEWLKNNPALTPAYRSAIGLALNWFKNPASGAPPDERHGRLRAVFSCWTGVTRGTPKAINDLTSLLLHDAFKGIGVEAQKARGFLQQAASLFPLLGREDNELINRVVDGVNFVNVNLFPKGQEPSQAEIDAYRDKLTEAVTTSWSRPELTGKLIKAFRRAGLGYEASWLGYLNVQQRGQDILGAISQTLNQTSNLQSHLADLLEEANEITPEQIDALLPAPAQRAQLGQLCQSIEDQALALAKALRKFQDNIR